ncbi:MAG: ATP-binding cassette domain-containing protein [Actinomycetaceae bacterium]|nr:ATP-binding cassette domain-containing protein [Actinomycetaceae bacterium]
MIRLHGLTKKYGGRAVVDNVSLAFPTGGITSLIGANGAGKSTLLHMTSRLVAPDAGRVELDGRDIRTLDSMRVARHLAILRQTNTITARLRVRELVEFGRYPYSRGRLTGEDREVVARAMHQMNLEHLAGRFLEQLSGGERQRAFVAMVLAQETDYLLLDEPLNNLDLKHSVDMMSALRKVAGELDRTVLIVVHDINIASAYSDRIVAMKDGRVVADGAPDDVVNPEQLAEIYGIDAEVHDIDGMRLAMYYR